MHRIYETTSSDAYRRPVLYGEPRSEHFQVALDGGHLLVRAGGITGEGSAFGGPIGYGHQVGNGRTCATRGTSMQAMWFST